MNQVYEHQNDPLNIPIMRDILENKKDFPAGWQTVKKYLELIEDHHVERGGLPTRLKDPCTNLRDTFIPLIEQGKFEMKKDNNRNYYRPV